MMWPVASSPIPFPVFESGFLENHDIFSFLRSLTPDRDPNPAGSDPCSAKENRAQTVADERQRRRMASNRESARRSRMRKQKHLEDLRHQLNRLRSENRDITNRLAVLSHHCHLLWRDNNRLRAESVLLSRRLSDLRRVLVFRQLQQFSTSNQQILN